MKRRRFITLSPLIAVGGLVGHSLGRSLFRRAGKNSPHLETASPQHDSDHQPIVRWSRSIPVRYEADIAVIGGGIAGVSAACSAARSGAKVVLVERFAITGGNSTTAGVASFCGETAGQGEVFDEIVADLERFRAIAPYRPFPVGGSRVFDHEILAIVLQELTLRRGIKLLLHTRFVDVRVVQSRIQECLLCGKSGLEALRAKQFIDCSGEADLTRAANFQTIKGRPEDGLQLPMSIMFFVRHVQKSERRAQLPSGWLDPVRTKDQLPMTSLWPNGPGSTALKVKVPMFDSTETESLTAAEIRGRRRMMEVLDYYQRVEGKSWILDHCSPQIGIREGCRIVGDYVLTVDDLRAGKRFDDGVARGVYYLDAHKPDDEKRTYVIQTEKPKRSWHEGLEVPPYQIPLRALIVKDASNLMAAGRCFSADQLALSSARVTTSSSMMGQAAGITAALCVQKNCDPRVLDPEEVKKTVVERGGRLEV